MPDLRRFWRWLCRLFPSTATLLAEARESFIERGFTVAEADQAALEMWQSCRLGLPTPEWIMERLRDA